MDTQPIAVGNLTANARNTLRRVLNILNAIRDDNRQQANSPVVPLPAGSPWAPIDHRRSYRVVMLDGPRGSGKTSLMLTLIDQWTRRRDPRRWPRGEDERALVKDDDVGVLPLRPLDFDPHPDHLHVYAWLVLAFEPVVRWLAPRDRRGGGDEDESGKSLQDHWRALYTDALLGWDEQAQRAMMQDDIDNFVAATLDSHRGWHRLRKTWLEFIDRMFIQLEERKAMDTDDLLLVPIDDLDLHPTMAGQLLRALRLMRHDRLVFILTGSRDHLHEVLTRELLPPPGMLDQDDEHRRERTLTRYESLASDMIDKVIPHSCICSVPLLTLAEALMFVAHGPNAPLADATEETVEQALSFGDEEDRRMLAALISHAPERAYRYREVVQIHWQSNQPGSWEDVAALCRLTRGADQRPVFETDPGGTLRLVRPGIVRVEPARHRRRPDVAGIRVAASLSFTFLFPGIRVSQVPVIMDWLYPGTIPNLEFGVGEWSPLQGTQGDDRLLPLSIGWPSSEPPSNLRELESDRRYLNNLLDAPENDESDPEVLLSAWIALNLRGTSANIDGLEEALSLDKALMTLGLISTRRGSSLRGTERLNRLREWCEGRLPLLAAPEFGLSVPLAERIIQWVKHESWFKERLASLATVWQDARRSALEAAFERERVRGSNPKMAAFAAMQHLEELYARHPWYRFLALLGQPVKESSQPIALAAGAYVEHGPRAGKTRAKPVKPTRARKPS